MNTSGTKRKRAFPSTTSRSTKPRTAMVRPGYKKYNSIPRSPYSQFNVIKIKRTVEGWWTGASESNLVATTAGLGRGIYFYLAQLSNYTEFTALFDQYKITGIRVQLLPQQNVNQTTSGAITTPTIMTCIDYNSVNIPAQSSDVLEFQNSQVTTYDQKVDRYFRPKIAVASYSGTFASYSSVDTWVDTNSPNVQYYGFRAWIPPVNTTAIAGWRIYVTYYLSFRMIQ